jgi:hypothetical protein
VTIALLLVAALLVAGAFAVGLRNWRLAVVGLLVYIPVSGIAIDATYGDRFERALAVLAKDFVFVLPAYAGFLVWTWRRRDRIEFPGAPVMLVFALAAVVVAQAFNPALPKSLVGLVGVKVWLFYVPLVWLGYHLVRTREELFKLFGLLSVTALVPAVIGLGEASLIYGGHSDDVYRLYGDAAAAVTQGYVGLELPGGGNLRRIPSTFSSFYQYYLFLAVMLGVAYAWWRGREWSRRMSVVAGGIWVVLLAASFLTGVRAAFFMTPVLLALILVLEGRTALRFAALRLVPAAILVLAVITLLPGTHLVAVWTEVFDVGRQEFWDVLVNSGREAVSLTTFGLGSGIDSVSARYAFSNDEDWQQFIYPVLGRWHESWYVKTWLELGVLGVATVLALFGTMLVRGVRGHLRIRDPGLRVASAVCVAVVAWAIVYAIKGQYLDLDPLNVYFWLFAGLMLRMPSLEEQAPAEEELTEEARPLAAAV